MVFFPLVPSIFGAGLPPPTPGAGDHSRGPYRGGRGSCHVQRLGGACAAGSAEPLAADAGDAAGDAKDAGEEGCRTEPWMFLGVSWDFYGGFHRGLMENHGKPMSNRKSLRTGMAHQQPKC